MSKALRTRLKSLENKLVIDGQSHPKTIVLSRISDDDELIIGAVDQFGHRLARNDGETVDEFQNRMNALESERSGPVIFWTLLYRDATDDQA